ncbi:MAG: GH39 [uncultured Thermomicrobiales bacterium]|uniref:GH39 n=1 Tax=uncultured Thermomicrobiales bacterium TaxID=1645740 RepID=A0A6J4VIS0_9BACT|nr:MAG: GH39 [uncultured Thermomicrobiales bacterium]
MHEMTRRAREIVRPQRQTREDTSQATTVTSPPTRPVARPRRSRNLTNRMESALLLLALSISLIVSGVGLDGFLNRGIVYGTSTVNGGGLSLGMNVFLEKEVERQNIVRSVQMLKAGGVTYARQSFPWQDVERAPGYYRDQDGQDTWAKYDFIVEQLTGAGISILARVDTIPRWARPTTDNFEAYDKGPPQDFNNYANFVATVAARYKGKISHFQVWNEPNLNGEWGGKPINPAQYGLLLRRTSEKVKVANPAALIVTAGLAQTTEDGVATNNLNELDFIQRLYDSGAGPYFDILSVMDYGLGHSPEDRRVGPERANFSRLLLAREVMVRNNDSQKPIWVSEYGWISLPTDWKGSYDKTWGVSVDAETQARWTVEGLERMRREWPWVTNVFVWGFRWVERPQERPDDPSRHFEVVDYDFTPRPAYLALRDWAGHQAVATSGVLPVRDSRLLWGGTWREQTLGGQNYRVANAPGATVRLTFQGTDVRLKARAGGAEGQLYATIDGQPVRGLRADKDGTYVMLRDGITQTHDAEIALASGLDDRQHILELRYGGFGETAINGVLIGRQRPFDWTAAFLITAGLAGVFAGLVAGARAALIAAGWLTRNDRRFAARRQPAWWNTRE